jgi:hypothetical protein
VGDSYRVAQAPRFPISRSIAERLERNGGTERAGERFQPREGWVALEASEVSALCAVPPAAMVRPRELSLFQIPRRLREAWWAEAAGQDDEARSHHALSEIVEFLRFKRLPLPERVVLQVLVNLPDRVSTRAAVAGSPGGLGFGAPPPVASINLSDEPSWMVLLPLPPLTLAERLDAAGAALADATTPAALTARFLETFPDEPLLRVRLDPGDGLWFPAEGAIHDGWTRGRVDVDVVLQLAPEVEGADPSPASSPQERKESA